MSDLDSKNLRNEKLDKQSFPAKLSSNLRYYLAPEVHRDIWEHGSADTSVEVCGVLVGQWNEDENGPFAHVTNSIRSSAAASKNAEVTFTHDSWAEINEQMDNKYSEKRIVGWYHTHPDFGIFLSDRDVFIHEHFFSGPGQVAYVIDPVRMLEGVFAWSEGKPKPMPHYWVGDQILTTEASQRRPHDSNPPPVDQQIQAQPASLPQRQELSVTTLLAWFCLFLIGYLLAGFQTNWDRQMTARGAVAHFGITKLMRLGLRKDLNEVRQALVEVHTVYGSPSKPKKNEKEEQEQRTAMSRDLQTIERAVNLIQNQYCYTDDELRVLRQLAIQKQQELDSRQKTSLSTKKKKKDAPKASESKTDQLPEKENDSNARAIGPPPIDTK